MLINNFLCKNKPIFHLLFPLAQKRNGCFGCLETLRHSLTTKCFNDFQINFVCAMWMTLCAVFLSVLVRHGDVYPAPFVKNDFLLMNRILKSPCI